MRSWLRALLGLALVAGLSGPARAETDLSVMRPAKIEALQTRFLDDGCYSGPVDGQASPATADAVSACPDQSPVLRIETGMHTALISAIAVDNNCKLMATGSRDKTVRLWSLPDGKLKRVIRLPISSGSGGQIYAVVLSPDGRRLAAGGRDTDYDKGKYHGLYLIDLASGSTRRLGLFESIIESLAFSADGARIAIGLSGQNGVRVLDTGTGREMLADRDYGSDVYGLVFAPDGSLFTTSFDGMVRRYAPDLTLEAKVKAPGGAQPFGIALDPAGRKLGAGYNDNTAISILDAATMKPLAKVEIGDLRGGNLTSVAWTADGRLLIVGGSAKSRFSGNKWHRFVRRLTSDGRQAGPDVPVSTNTIFDIKACGSGVAFAAADPSVGLLSSEGKVRVLQGPVTADMRGKLGSAFTISSDAAVVRFGLGPGEARPVLFDLLAGTLADASSVPAGLNSARTGGLPVTEWADKTEPKFRGTPIILKNYEISRSLAVRPDQAGFVLGTESRLRAFDAEGYERWKTPAPDVTYGVDMTADGKLVVAASADGTIRWHRWSDGAELLALFIEATTRKWVAWTPTGYYMASPGGEDLIGWHVNRGWNQQADFFPASRFRDKFNRPDVVRAVLRTLDEAEAVKQADAAAGRREDQKPIIERLPPVVTILSPSAGSTVAPGDVEIRYNIRTASGGPVERVEAFVDGAKIEARGLGPATRPSSPSADGTAVLTLPMPAHDATISLVAYAGGKTSDAAHITLKGVAPAGPAVSDDALKPSLYALLIGVTHYDDKSFDLGYAADDARAFAQALKSQDGKLYRHVEVKVLTDKDATVPGVRDGLVWLSRQTTSRDLAIVFEAGHGLQDKKGRFFFGTRETDPTRLFATAFSNDEMEEAIAGLPGKKMLFMDACHAGAALDGQRNVERVDMSEAVNDFAQAESGMVVYGASTGREVSYESDDWHHGAFTKALIEGIGEGKADLTHQGTVTTASLDFFLAERVKDLTKGRQHPVMSRPKTVPDFPIALAQ